MPSLSLRRKTVLLLLTLLLACPWAASAAPAFPNLLARAWSLLSSVWNKEGCYIDPSGRCGQPRATSRADTGCNIDPDGRCRP